MCDETGELIFACGIMSSGVGARSNLCLDDLENCLLSDSSQVLAPEELVTSLIDGVE